MSTTRSSSIPLPCALLALSVAVCIGAAGPVDASTLRAASSIQAEQRETLEHLLGAIQQAAKKLTDRLTGHSALYEQARLDALAEANLTPIYPAGDDSLTVLILREALLNLPPPAC